MYFFIIIIVLTSIFISVKFYRWNRIKTSSMGEYSRVTTAINKIKKGTTESKAKARRTKDLVAAIFEEMKIFPKTTEYVSEVDKMLAALELKENGSPVTCNDIYLKQCLFGIATVPVALMFVLASSISFGSFQPAWFVTVLLAPVLFQIPLWQLRQEFMEEQLSAMSQWLEFYNMYYSQFSQREANALMIDVVDNFLPLANPALSKMLKRFRTDLEIGGEEYALDRLKNRYVDNIKIHKFVSAAKMRLGGDESAIDMLRSVQDDLLAEENLAYVDYLKVMTKRAEIIITAVVYCGLALTSGVVLVAMVYGG